jgi:hypothetical protein
MNAPQSSVALIASIQSLRHAAAAKSTKIDTGGASAAVTAAAASASRSELLGRVLRRLQMQLALPRCLRAWALQAAAAAAAWSEKEVDAPRGAGERFGPSPVQAIVPQTQTVKGQAAKAQISRGPLVKGYSLDNSSEGWFGGGSASPSTEPAGASSSSYIITPPVVSYSHRSVFSQSACHSSARCPIVRCLSSYPSRLFCIPRQRRSVPNIS